MTAPLITMDVGNVKAQVDKIGGVLDAALANVIVATKEAMTEVTNDAVSEAQSRINNRSGDLSRSGTVEEVTISGDELRQRFGFNSKHGRQTDQGGPIVPRNGQNLAIPLDPILTARGVPRYPSPRAEPGLFLLKLWGKLFLAKQMGPTAESIELHWLLTPRVEQRGTRFFTGVVQERAPDMPRVVAERISAKLGGGA